MARTLDRLIEELQAIREEHGGDLEILTFNDEVVSYVQVYRQIKTVDWGSGEVVKRDTEDFEDPYGLHYEDYHNKYKDEKKHIVVVDKCVSIY